MLLNSNITDTEYIILENIYTSDRQNLSLKQRDLAQLARTSLGMTNSILKQLVQKGWITAKKLNSRNIRYAVTMEGINEIIHRSYGFFKRTIKNVAYYKDAVNGIIEDAAGKNIKTVLLLGTSDLDFIIEHSCNYYGLSFLKSADISLHSPAEGKQTNTLIFFTEDIPVTQELKPANCVFISQLLLDIQAAS